MNLFQSNSNRQELYGIGSLQIIVYGTGKGNPISNASIHITDENDNPITDPIFTNSVGRSEVINFNTPPIDFSMVSDSSQPYATCNINVVKDGYRQVFVNRIQIFPDATAIQVVYLNVAKGNNLYHQINIKPPVLRGNFPPKIPEDKVKSLHIFSGLVVLPDVVVPEFVTVHDGEPSNSSASNYTVSFRDYIKNVTSCEVYPNWPKETIKANVLAIISFTLNRIYTEWYKAKGYHFTITSSTSYDQAFDYGRNIFKEISTIVDEVFKQYITMPEIRQPLLTQYCDGRKSICPSWMSQWGSKELGDQGYDYMYILKYYYGNNIYLDQAKKVENILHSFKGNLSTGSSSSEVRIIQEQLNAISNHYPLLEKLKVDGVYGEKTKQVVKIFQEVFHLPITGVVNSATWYRISEIFVAVTKMA